MSTLSTLSGYGFMLVILFAGMCYRDRKTKYRLRMAGYWYMIFFCIIQVIYADELWIEIYTGLLAIVWLLLADKDFRSNLRSDREYAKLDKLKEETQAILDKMFYDRRN